MYIINNIILNYQIIDSIDHICSKIFSNVIRVMSKTKIFRFKDRILGKKCASTV